LHHSFSGFSNSGTSKSRQHIEHVPHVLPASADASVSSSIPESVELGPVLDEKLLQRFLISLCRRAQLCKKIIATFEQPFAEAGERVFGLVSALVFLEEPSSHHIYYGPVPIYCAKLLVGHLAQMLDDCFLSSFNCT
jgi:hypothetical protein